MVVSIVSQVVIGVRSSWARNSEPKSKIHLCCSFPVRFGNVFVAGCCKLLYVWQTVPSVCVLEFFYRSNVVDELFQQECLH